MGKLSVIFVFAAILIGGTLLYNMQRTSLNTEENLSARQLEFQARNAAHAGLEAAVRGMLLNTGPSIPPTSWSGGQITDVPYEGGTYSVVSTVGGCSSLDLNSSEVVDSLLSRPNFYPDQHLVEVVSTGTYNIRRGERFQQFPVVRHQVNACYVRLDASDATPPAFDYAFISNDEFEFNAGVDVYALEGEGNIHSNESMYLGPNVEIHGNATYTDETGSRMMPNADVSGDFTYADSVPMQEFDPEDYDHGWTTTGLPEDESMWSGDVVTLPSSGSSIYQQYEFEDRFLWYVDGDLILDGSTHLVIPENTIIVVTGKLDVGGTASITSSGTEPSDHDSTEDWVHANLEEGHPKSAFYVNGDIDIRGTGNLVGNLYTNSDFTLRGGGQGSNLVGSIAAVGEIDGRGGGAGSNFWYTAIAQENVIPGVLIPKELISLIAISEWGDQVVRTANPIIVDGGEGDDDGGGEDEEGGE